MDLYVELLKASDLFKDAFLGLLIKITRLVDLAFAGWILAGCVVRALLLEPKLSYEVVIYYYVLI